MMMRAAYYERTGAAAEVLTIGELDMPGPAHGEVLVRIGASGVNPSDVKARAGARAGASGMPYPRVIPHSDGAGVIEAVGPGISEARVGELVWLWNAQWGRAYGTAASHIALPASQAVALPAHVPLEQGACLGIPALTAHACLFCDGPISGKTVLITGAAGAVGGLAVRMAKLGGARVIASASGEAQGERARRAGADHIVDHRAADFKDQIGNALDGERLDRVIEVEFGANVAHVSGWLRDNATIVAYGSAAAPAPALPFYALLFKGITLRMLLVYILPQSVRDTAIRDIGLWLEADQLRPEVSDRFSLAEVAAAHERVARGGKMGSVVLII